MATVIPHSPPEQRIARRSLHDEVVERLRDLIVEGELEPGKRVPERVLCERFGISRTPLREALKVLASEGLVELLPNRGAVVAPLTVTELDEIIEVMVTLEGLAGMLAASRMSDAAISEVKALHYEMLACHARADLHSYFKLNQAIHLAIIAGAGNATLVQTYGALNGRVRRFRYMANLSGERWDHAVAEHDEILSALTKRDATLLSRLLSDHLRNKYQHLKQAYQAGVEAAE
ncbi:MAG: GntR family transcriptional regulator [Alphaproteobacteria bacterium]|nr:GntR family transcriptional regulator [Alphaproteobacteria bacterium]MBU0799168.1 GntR family transcriptional regulator [Alphaproteobacteria bacterium]MBU0888803.1 GntR family transcriptional regulator [Alphaproteobacteria bacterium]MBU1813823.1 GntR family transcriptional regulator [Alphaproteobacteria bacterium]